MAEAAQSHSEHIEGSVDECAAVLLDFEAYPTWSTPILEARVLERDAEGRGTLVEYRLDMRVRTVGYTLAYTFDLPGRIAWSLAGGDLAAVDGEYLLEPVEGGAQATCRQEIDVGFWVPGPIRRIAERQALRDSVVELKKEVERRKG